MIKEFAKDASVISSSLSLWSKWVMPYFRN